MLTTINGKTYEVKFDGRNYYWFCQASDAWKPVKEIDRHLVLSNLH